MSVQRYGKKKKKANIFAHMQKKSYLCARFCNSMSNILHIYHGSVDSIPSPVLGNGKAYNDYGLGFYCTENAELAKEWACATDKDGFANHYELNMEGLRVLNLNEKPYHILNWLAILLQNRKFTVTEGIAQRAKDYIISHFGVDYQSYDVIIGYRADDSYFAYAGDFVSNSLSLKDLGQAMALGKLGEQVVLKSQKAFEALRFVESVPADRQTYFALYSERDTEARANYRKIAAQPLVETETYILDIIRNNWTNDEPSLS